MKFISLLVIALFWGGEIFAHAEGITTQTTTGEPMVLVGKPSDLKPPCHADIMTHANGGPNDFYITLKDSSKQNFAFQLVDKNIHFIFADQKQSNPGSPEEQTLLAILKDIDTRTYNPSLEKNADFPYTYGKSGTCFNQLALRFAIRLFELRCQTKAKVNPDGIEFYPQTSQRMNIAGLSLLGQGWKEVSKPSELKPPCTICNVDSALSDDANFQFILIDTDKQLLAVSYGQQKLYVGKNQTVLKPGEPEEQLLLKIIQQFFDPIYDPVLNGNEGPETDSLTNDRWFAQDEVKEAIRALKIRCETKAPVPDEKVWGKDADK